MKPAFIVTVHQSELYRPKGHEFLTRYLESLKDNLKIPYDVFIMENASEFKYSAPNEYHYHYFPDQKLGMTRAWNVGVQLAIENGNDILSVTNEDVYFNDTINDYFSVIENFKDLENSIFGPCSDCKTTFPLQYRTQTINEITNITNSTHGIHGWFTTFSKFYYEKYNINKNIFDPGKYWSGQEFFQHRDWELGAKSYVIKSCILHHDHTGSWRKTKSDIPQPTQSISKS